MFLQDKYLAATEAPVSATSSLPTSNNPPLPSCKSLMVKGSPFHDGGFLTRHSIPVSWHPREDSSRELRHSMCTLHRYTAEEARQCLEGRHINFIGDSLSRYQYLGLAWFLHKGSHPPRFERKVGKPCPYKDAVGNEACSPPDQPNVCMESDWWGPNAWLDLIQAVGGKYFDGYMEANARRKAGSNDTTIVEDYFYASPPNKNKASRNRVLLSFNNEIGWYANPLPIHGFTFTGCAFSGTCNFSNEMAEERFLRARNLDFDFSEPLDIAIAPSGALRKVLPPVNISVYNRGLWGVLSKERAEKLMPLFHGFSQGSSGRCYFRSTTGNFQSTLAAERSYVREAALWGGCGYLDFAHLLDDFNQLLFKFPRAPNQEYGNVQDERDFIYWDSLHFKPWVYEELNNMLLNVLCNNS